MTSDEADRLGPPEFVFRVSGVRGIRFELRPLDRRPRDATIGFLYRRTGNRYRQSGFCIFRGGEWRNGKNKPIDGDYLWAALVDD